MNNKIGILAIILVLGPLLVPEISLANNHELPMYDFTYQELGEIDDGWNYHGSIRAGESRELSINVRNFDRNRWIDLRFSVVGSENFPSMPNEWLEFSQREIRIEPNGEGNIVINLTIPEDARSQNYRSVMEGLLINYQGFQGGDGGNRVLTAVGRRFSMNVMERPACEDDEVLNGDWECIEKVYADLNLNGEVDGEDTRCYMDMLIADVSEAGCMEAEINQADLTCNGLIDIFDVDGAVYVRWNNEFPPSIDRDGDLIPDCRQNNLGPLNFRVLEFQKIKAKLQKQFPELKFMKQAMNPFAFQKIK